MNAHGMSKRKVSIVGNYKFTGITLGKGNFARVEEACHELLGMKVAVKIMDLNVIKEDYVVRNLFREAKIMSELKHPCIISLFETMQKSDKLYYLVTEIVTGGDLCTYVKAQVHGRLDEKTAKYFSQQFVSAIAYMHKKGIVHRDLKMENVMLNGAQNLIKIVDFGLSNKWSDDSPLKTHCGSPEYAAPELFVTGKVYGPEVDLWSLGIILYGMVVGQLPFVCSKKPTISSQERRQLLVAQINKGISAPQRKAIAPFSLEFKNLMNRLLSADSKKRINIKEAIVHPWITENGKKLVRTNPLKKMTSATQNKMINDIISVCGKQKEEIIEVIQKNPFGTVAGMYNILFHRLILKPFIPNLITKSILDNSNAVTPKSSEKRRTDSPMRLLQNLRLKEDKEKKQRPDPKSTSNLNKTRTVLTKKDIDLLPTIETGAKNDESARRNPRPRSVQFTKNHEVTDLERPVTSAFHKRQEYSASLAMRGISHNGSRSVKSRRSTNEEETDRRKGSISLRRCERCEGKMTRVPDGSISKKTPKTPTSTTRRSSTDRSRNILAMSITDPHKNECSTNFENLSHIYALMKLITPPTGQLKRSSGDHHTKSSAKSSSNRSFESNNSGIPILTKPTSRQAKKRNSQPNCKNIQENVTNARRLR